MALESAGILLSKVNTNVSMNADPWCLRQSLFGERLYYYCAHIFLPGFWIFRLRSDRRNNKAGR